MKNISEFINESKTSLVNIEKYAKSWITEYKPQEFDQVLESIFNGIKKGVEENKKYYKEDADKVAVERAFTIIINLIQTKEEFEV